MNLSKASDRYSVIQGKFACQQCEQMSNSARFYNVSLDITWKCKSCEHVSTVNIYKERGY